MKIDELIKELEKVREEHGNLEVAKLDSLKIEYFILNSLDVDKKGELSDQGSLERDIPSEKVVRLNI